MNLNYSPYLADGRIGDRWVIDFQVWFYSREFYFAPVSSDEFSDDKVHVEELLSYFSLCDRFGLIKAIENQAKRIKAARDGKRNKKIILRLEIIYELVWYR